MATYTLTLTNSYPSATYRASSMSFNSSTQTWTPNSITPPVWNSGRRSFLGYFSSSGITQWINADGTRARENVGIASNFTVYEKWSGGFVDAVINPNGGTSSVTELEYEGGAWYQIVNGERSAFNALNPIQLPTRSQYAFLGCYDTNSTAGTLYIDESGYPTAAFLALVPESDITIYAQWQQVSYKVTVSHSSATESSTVFYAKIGETGSGRFYADDLCHTQISSITPPQRELYRWNGCFSSSTQSAATTYIDSSGAFQQLLFDLAISGNKTLSYGNYWTAVSYKLTLSGSGWSFVPPKYYTSRSLGNVYADWFCETAALSSVAVPVKVGYRFLGYYSTSAISGTLYVDRFGAVQAALNSRKAATTLYAVGRAASCTISLSAGSGTGGTQTLYYDATSGDAGFFGEDSATKTAIAIPTYTGNTFLGYFTDESEGTQVIGADGAILNSWTPTADATVYAHWQIDTSIIDVDAGDGAGGTSRFWYRASTGKFYADAELATETTSVILPTRALYNANGLYSESSGGTQLVASNGVISPSWTPSGEFVQVYAQYSRRCYRTDLPSAPVAAIYRAPNGSSWYSDDALTAAVTNVGIPTATGYTFAGYTYGGTPVVSASGDILPAAAIDEDYAATDSWTANTYTLHFNGNGGTPSYSSKTVTYGSAIGELPTASYPGKTFREWRIDGRAITTATVWEFASAKTAMAKYGSSFGDVNDYFYLASATLVPVASDGGESKQHVCAYNATNEQPATQTSGTWVNPSVTYNVIGDMTLAVQLGKGFAAARYGESGYMITSVEVRVAAGAFPAVTVSGVANEGVDSVKKYSVSVAIEANAHAQNLMNAISGGGELQDLTLVAACDPVVVAENNMPCASDCVHARIEVSANVGAYNGESEPTAGTGFVQVGAASSTSDVEFKNWSVTVRKELN